MILKVIVNLLARLNDLVFARLGFYLTNRNRNFRDSVRNHVITDSINLVIDVGASHGQYGQWLRKSKFRGRLISFEPEVDSFKKLQTKSQVDGLWQAHNVALGASPSSGTLQVSGNFVSSSILEMTNLHQTAAEGSAPVGVQEVEILPLDGFINPIMRFKKVDFPFPVLPNIKTLSFFFIFKFIFENISFFSK